VASTVRVEDVNVTEIIAETLPRLFAGARSASCPMGTGGSFTGIKASGA